MTAAMISQTMMTANFVRRPPGHWANRRAAKTRRLVEGVSELTM